MARFRDHTDCSWLAVHGYAEWQMENPLHPSATTKNSFEGMSQVFERGGGCKANFDSRRTPGEIAIGGNNFAIMALKC
jgi:hypothetical protein